MSCTFSDIYKLPQEKRCAIALGACAGQQSQVNFFELYFCSLDENLPLLILITLVTIFYVFQVIQIAIEKFVSPSISKMSDSLGISEALAAVTLLAVANGAGDVITALVASGTASGISYNIGSLYGAGLFCTSFVMAQTIRGSTEDITISKSTIFRDVGFYIIATLMTIGFAIYGELNVWTSIAFLLLYVCLVLVVVIQDKFEHKQEEQKSLLPQNSVNSSEQGNNQDTVHYNEIQRGSVYLAQKKLDQLFTQKSIDDQKRSTIKLNSKKVPAFGNKSKWSALKQHVKSTIQFKSILMMKKWNKKEVEKDNEETMIDKILNFFILPIEVILTVTCSPADEENLELDLVPVSMFGGVFFLGWTFNQAGFFTGQYLLFLLGIYLAVFLLYSLATQYISEKFYEEYLVFFNIISCFQGLVWSFIATSILIDLLTMIGIIAQLSSTYLGLTILAVGNALPDGLTVISLSKKGLAEMGITGVYAGQLFGLLVGFGVAMLKKCAQEGPQTFQLFNFDSLIDQMVIYLSLFCLVFTFIYGILNKFIYDRKLSYMLGAIYIIFILSSTMVQIYQILT